MNEFNFFSKDILDKISGRIEFANSVLFGFFSQNSKSVLAAQLIIIFGLIFEIFF